jgi:hypothetical protein
VCERERERERDAEVPNKICRAHVKIMGMILPLQQYGYKNGNEGIKQNATVQKYYRMNQNML